MVLWYMFLSYKCSMCEPFVTHRYQYDSLILSKQTWAYPRQHLQQLLWCVVSVRLNLPEVEERKLCPLRYYANCVSTTPTVLILHNVESVYFFYSTPVQVYTIPHYHIRLQQNLILYFDVCTVHLVQFNTQTNKCTTWGLFDRASSSWNKLHHPHRTHDLRSGSQDHHPSKNSVQKTKRCNSTSNAPDDERMYPKHVELRIHQ